MALYVRELSKKEGNQLKHNALQGTDPVKVRRSLVVLASAQKMKVPEISDLYHLSCEHIRKIIHHFNEEGMASLAPHYGGGRPRTFTDEQRADIVELAQIPPNILGYPFTNRSLPKLKQAAEQKKIVKSISIETIRVILGEADITYQHTKTWKESDDPEFASKKTNRKPLPPATDRWTSHLSG